MANIIYKEWLPDQPELNNPGLVRAQNVLPSSSGYEPYRPLGATAGAAGTIPSSSNITGAFMALGVFSGFQVAEVHAASGQLLFTGIDSGSINFSTAGSRTNSAAIADQFVQFDNLVIVAGDRNKPYFRTAGSFGSTYTALGVSGTNNSARAIGVINRFVVLGNMNATASAATSGANANEYLLRWSGIDQPTSWPVANSATATAQQSGEQFLPSRFGPIYAIYGGDQYGIIMQQSGISRMTYVGPPVVFQFDSIDETRGCYYPGSSVQAGKFVYFVSENGFYRTDGVGIENIGEGKVNKFFENDTDPGLTSFDFSCGYDSQKDLIYFAYTTSGAFNYLDTMLIFSPSSGNWGRASDNVDKLVSQKRSEGDPRSPLLAFNSASPRRIGRFNQTAGSAVLETGDMELAEGGRGYIDGIKPHVESSGTAPAIGVRIGIRNDLGTTPTYTSTAGPHSRTGFANFRDKGITDGKYARVELNITGNFRKAIGFELDGSPSGEA